jgi:hypothetical protein
VANQVNCRYFYGDYFRGKNREECRLLDANPRNTRAWHRKLCNTCPVPGIVLASNSRNLGLEAEVEKHWLRERVKVTLAVCLRHVEELTDPTHCPKCAEEQRG